MSHQWLAAENFERSHDLIAALNALIIHLKLSLQNRNDTNRIQEVGAATQRLIPFLSEFDELIREIESDQEAPVLGADSRLTALARQFVSTRQQSSSLRAISFDEVTNLLSVDVEKMAPAKMRRLVEFLTTLRGLLETNTHADIETLLGVL